MSLLATLFEDFEDMGWSLTKKLHLCVRFIRDNALDADFADFLEDASREEDEDDDNPLVDEEAEDN